MVNRPETDDEVEESAVALRRAGRVAEMSEFERMAMYRGMRTMARELADLGAKLPAEEVFRDHPALQKQYAAFRDAMRSERLRLDEECDKIKAKNDG